MLTVRSTINIASQTVPPIIPVVQGDTGRAILFTLADFTIPAGATATYYVQKPSGEAVYNNATIDGNNVLVELTAQSIIEKGDNYGQVRIAVGEDIVTSFDFILLVKEFRGIDAVQSLTEMNIFDKAVEQAAEEIDEVKTDALEAIDDAKDEAIEEVTSNFDLQLNATSIKGVQNQVITQAINTVNNAIGDLSGETVTPTATNNYGVGGNVGQVIETWATTEYWHGIYTVSAGNTYGITTVSDFPQQLVVWFTNASNTIIENHKAFATDHVEMVCTVPTGATKLFVMSYGYDAYHGTVQKVEPLSETVSNLKDDFYDSLVTDTASGAIASFPDGADNIPVKSLTVDIEPVQSGSGDPSPDNVRPISGHTSAVVTRTGKNLFDKSNTANILNNTDFSGATIGVSSQRCVVFIPCKPNRTYMVSRKAGLTNERFAIGYTTELPAVGVAVANVTLAPNSQTVGNLMSLSVTTGSDAKYVVVWAYWDNMTGALDDLQIELGSTATDYEPYNGQEYTIDLGGTVYGGTLDVTTGVLTVDRQIVDLGTLTWIESSISVTGVKEFLSQEIKNVVKKPARNGDVANVICENYKTVSADNTWAGVIGIAIRTDGNVLCDNTTNYANASEFKTAMDGVQLAYEIAEPFTVQLTANDIKTLLGTNNIWSDAGNVDVEYRADTKLYIEKLTAPTEDDMVADTNIVSGQYFMVGNTLYKATANIASGGAITPNVNCTRKSLPEALNEINA